MYNETDIDRLRGSVAYDRNGDRVGNIGEVYLDDQTGQPMWVTVNTGFFGMNTSFVPLAGSSFEADDRLVLAHDKDIVKDAPNLAEDGHLDRAQEDELYQYYGVSGGDIAGDTLRTRRWDDNRDDGSLFDRDADGRGPVGEVLDGPDGSASDGRGDVGLDPRHDRGYDRDGDYDRTGDRSILDRDGDGRGPVGEVLDGPDGSAGDRRGDVGLDPHADRGYAADAGNYEAGGDGFRDEGFRDDGYLGDGVRDDRSMFDRDGDGRGPVGEVLDGPDGTGDRAYDGGGYDDRRNGGPLLDSDRDGRGPIEEVLNGPDDPNHPRRN